MTEVLYGPESHWRVGKRFSDRARGSRCTRTKQRRSTWQLLGRKLPLAGGEAPSGEMSFLVRSKHDRCSRALQNVNAVPGTLIRLSNEPRSAALGISPHARVRGAYARGRVRLGTRSDARLKYDRRGPGMRDVAFPALTALGSHVAASEADSAVGLCVWRSRHAGKPMANVHCALL